MLFIWAYFREWKMSVAALVALAHDVVITTGIYSLSGFEVTPATVTGLLTILGFSLYDTVVVFDKVRENTKNLRKSRMTYAEAANLAVNQTLVRSINTSIVALIPVGAILYVGVFQLGSGSLKDLALALFVGMAVGLYSSVFIATPLLVHLKGSREGRAGARAARPGQASARRRPLRLGAGVQRGPAGPRPTTTAQTTTTEPAAPPAAGGPATPAHDRTPPAAAASCHRAHGPVKPSGSAGRVQPTRQSRSKRGKK